MAARAGHTEVAKYLLQNKAKANAKAKVSSVDRKGGVPRSRPPQPGEEAILICSLGLIVLGTPILVTLKTQALLCGSPVRGRGLSVWKWCFYRMTKAQRAALAHSVYRASGWTWLEEGNQ